MKKIIIFLFLLILPIVIADTYDAAPYPALSSTFPSTTSYGMNFTITADNIRITGAEVSATGTKPSTCYFFQRTAGSPNSLSNGSVSGTKCTLDTPIEVTNGEDYIMQSGKGGSSYSATYDGVSSYPQEDDFWTYNSAANNLMSGGTDAGQYRNIQGLYYENVTAGGVNAFENTTWDVTSAYDNATAWRNGYSNYVYTKDNTPTITVNITVASNVSITTSNLNYTAAVGADAGAKCATTDTTTHTCTLPASLELVNGEQCIYMAIAGTTDATSTSGCLSINYNPCKIISGEDNEIPCDCTITDSTTGGFDLTLTGSGQAIAEKDLMVSSLYMPNSCSIAFYTNTSLRAGD